MPAPSAPRPPAPVAEGGLGRRTPQGCKQGKDRRAFRVSVGPCGEVYLDTAHAPGARPWEMVQGGQTRDCELDKDEADWRHAAVGRSDMGVSGGLGRRGSGVGTSPRDGDGPPKVIDRSQRPSHTTTDFAGLELCAALPQVSEERCSPLVCPRSRPGLAQDRSGSRGLAPPTPPERGDEPLDFVALLKNISSRILEEEVMDAIESLGFPRHLWRFNMPVRCIHQDEERTTKLNKGYAFVRFWEREACERFVVAAAGFKFPGRKTDKALSVIFSVEPRQSSVADGRQALHRQSSPTAGIPSRGRHSGEDEGEGANYIF